MRPLRILRSAFSSRTNVHLMSRVIDGKMIFADLAADRFRELVARQCAFSPRHIDGPRKMQGMR